MVDNVTTVDCQRTAIDSGKMKSVIWKPADDEDRHQSGHHPGNSFPRLVGLLRLYTCRRNLFLLLYTLQEINETGQHHEVRAEQHAFIICKVLKIKEKNAKIII